MVAMKAIASQIVPLVAAAHHRPSPEQRVQYELARLRVADTRAPQSRFAHLIRTHD
jgi:hypothetical protein